MELIMELIKDMEEGINIGFITENRLTPVPSTTNMIKKLWNIDSLFTRHKKTTSKQIILNNKALFDKSTRNPAKIHKGTFDKIRVVTGTARILSKNFTLSYFGPMKYTNKSVEIWRRMGNEEKIT